MSLLERQSEDSGSKLCRNFHKYMQTAREEQRLGALKQQLALAAEENKSKAEELSSRQQEMEVAQASLREEVKLVDLLKPSLFPYALLAEGARASGYGCRSGKQPRECAEKSKTWQVVT